MVWREYMWRNVNSRETHQIKDVRQNWECLQDPRESWGDEAGTELKGISLSLLRNDTTPTGNSHLVEGPLETEGGEIVVKGPWIWEEWRETRTGANKCVYQTLLEKIATLQNCHEDTIKELIAGNNLILNTNEMNCLSQAGDQAERSLVPSEELWAAQTGWLWAWEGMSPVCDHCLVQDLHSRSLSCCGCTDCCLGATSATTEPKKLVSGLCLICGSEHSLGEDQAALSNLLIKQFW